MIAPDNLLLGTSSWSCSDDRLLKPFLKCLPKDFKFALEIRNKNWISRDFLELLREHSVAFALVAQA